MQYSIDNRIIHLNRSFPWEDELWFPDAEIDDPLHAGEPPAVCQEERLDETLTSAESMDMEDPPCLGVCGEDFNVGLRRQHIIEMRRQDFIPVMIMTPQTSFGEPPKPPVVVSPPHKERDTVTPSPTCDHFYRHQQYKQALIENLAASMHRSQATRRQILRQRKLLSDHSRRVFQRLEQAQGRMWYFINENRIRDEDNWSVTQEFLNPPTDKRLAR